MIGIAVYFALGAACGMGIGSAGLLVTYLVIAKGMNQGDARLVNLIFFICSGLAAAAVHLRRRKVDKALFLRLMIPAVSGGALGALCGKYIPSSALRPAFGILLIIAGADSLIKLIAQALSRLRAKRGKVTKAVCLTKIQVIIIIYAGVPGKTKLPTVSEEALASSRRRQLFA